MIALLVGMALAEPGKLGQVAFSLGAEYLTNDPFLVRAGGRVGVAWAPLPWLEGGAGFSVYPSGAGPEDWKPLATQLLSENSVSPDISRMTRQAQGTLRAHLLRADLDDRWRAGLGLAAGAHLVRTVDDLTAIQMEGEPSAEATAIERHVGPVLGGFAYVREDHLELRVRFERVAYVETVNTTIQENKVNLFLGAEVALWLP